MEFDFFKLVKTIRNNKVEIKQRGIVSQTLVETMPPKRTKEDYKQIINYNFEELQMMELCQTFKPQFIGKFGGDQVLMRNYIESGLKKLIKDNTNVKILLINETSPLGTWHYHGYIQGCNVQGCRNLTNNYKTLFHKIKTFMNSMGRSKIGYIRNTVEYENYVLKDIDEEYNEGGDRNENLDIFINLK